MAKNGKRARDDLNISNCYCEEQSDEAISSLTAEEKRDCFVAKALLPMTWKEAFARSHAQRASWQCMAWEPLSISLLARG